MIPMQLRPFIQPLAQFLGILALATLCACGFANSVKEARPMVIQCKLSPLERHQLILETLQRHSYQVVKEDRASGTYTAARFPAPVFLGDQVMFQGGLHLAITSDSSRITLKLFKAMDSDTDKPKIEESYDERNSPLYVKPFFDGLLADLRKGCEK